MIHPFSIVVSRTPGRAATVGGGAGVGRAHAARRTARTAVLASALVLTATLALGTGCPPRSVVPRAIRARGGPLDGFVRRSEAEVHVGFPGTWSWRTVFRVPDRYAWTILTTGPPDHYLFDGATARVFVGERQIGEEPGPTSALRTHARFVAVANLDVLELPSARVAPLARDEVPPGAVEGLAVVLADDGSRYRLGFDRRTLLVYVEGPVALPPLGTGPLVARFADFRRAARWLLPYRTEYTFAGEGLATEHALAVCPDPPGLAAGAFQAPGTLPDCPPGVSGRTAPSPGSRTASGRW